jgi:methyltransferase family protein
MSEVSAENRCRLCGQETAFVFKQRVIDRYDVAYFVCDGCGSLQTEFPHWLGEAYSDAVMSIDPGAAQRVLDNFVLTRVIARLFDCRRILDYGGGAGLLCRLLRDVGWDAYSFDRYASPSYATGFTATPSENFDLVTAYEVLEHIAEPAKDLGEIFAGGPRVVLASTYIYNGQGSDWWYLAPEEGQHVFMYSSKALDLIATRFGYRVHIYNGFFIFCREPLTAMQSRVLPRLTPNLVHWLRPFALTLAQDGAQRDFDIMRGRT